MKLNVRYRKPTEEPYQSEVELRKNNKGYNIQIEGKYYFPKRDNPLLQNLEEFKDKEVWVVVTKDEVNFGYISFAAPDYFARFDENKKEVWVEKEVPLNQIDDPEEPFVWDYVEMDRCSSIEQTDRFIDNLESQGCPEVIIKEAIETFYSLQK
jgi:hypothetical protein